MEKEAVLRLAEIYKNFQAPDGGGDKGTAHSYIEIYETEMAKTKNITMLEIGIWEGHSIAMWEQYFEDSQVIGIDIALDKVKFDLRNCIKADATRPIPNLTVNAFDYIIDDGSHRVQDQIQSFDWLWGKVKPGGKYFIEDIVNDQALADLKAYMASRQIEIKIYDNRSVKGRRDDIMLVATKGVN